MVNTKDINLLKELHSICYQVAEEYCGTTIIGADLFYSLVTVVDYRILANVTYIMCNEQLFNLLLDEVTKRYQNAVKLKTARK